MSVLPSSISSISASSSATGRRDDLDPLVLVGSALGVGEPGGQEHVDVLVGEARRGVVGASGSQSLGRLADLLAQLALGGSSGASPSTSSFPAGSSSKSGSPIASRGWRTR